MINPSQSAFTMREIIKARLEALVLDFEPVWLDRKMLDMAIEDLTAYLKYLWANSLETLKWTYENAQISMLSDEQVFQFHFLGWLNAEPINGRIELHLWLSLWYGKWKERVRLIFRKEDKIRPAKTMELLRKGSDLLTNPEVRMYQEFVKYSLLKCGEFVGTESISELIVKKEAGRLRSKPKTQEEQMCFASQLMKETKIVAGWFGPLISLEVKEGFFHDRKRKE